MSIMQEQKMIDESLLLRYFEQEVSEEEKKKVEEWIHSSEANSRMETQTHLAIYRKGCCHISSPRSYSDYYLLVFR